MRHTFLVAFLFSVTVAFSQASKKVYDVKYYFGESVFQFKTNNIDSIKNKTTKDVFLPDSIEMYRNGKMEGCKLIFEEGITYKKNYKRGKLIFENYFENDSLLIYSSFLDSFKLDKTILKISSNKNFFYNNNLDTLIITNKSIPLLNFVFSITGNAVSSETVDFKHGTRKFLLKFHKPIQSVKIEISALVDGLAPKKKYRVETFIIPVHSE